MVKKNVLIVSYSYPPSNVPAAQRPFALAKYLNKEKYNIKVITCLSGDSPLGSDKNMDILLDGVQVIDIPSLMGNQIKNIRQENKAVQQKTIVAKIKGKILGLAATFVIPDKAIFWVPKVIGFLRKNPELVKNTDILFSTSPLFSNHIIASYIFKRNRKIKWIADIRDFFFTGSEGEESWKSTISRRLERKVIKNAASLTFVSESMKELYSKAYPSHTKKMSLVYNGVDKKELEGLENTQSVSENSEVTIFYSGSFYKGLRSPLTLLELIDRAAKVNPVLSDKVKIVIAGEVENELKEKMSTAQSFSKVSFLGKVPRRDLLQIMREADLLWLIVADVPSHYRTIPIKLFEYVALDKFILNFSPESAEVSDIMKKYQLGMNIPKIEDATVSSFMEILTSIVEKKPFNLSKKEAFMNDFDREAIILKYEELFDRQG